MSQTMLCCLAAPPREGGSEVLRCGRASGKESHQQTRHTPVLLCEQEASCCLTLGVQCNPDCHSQCILGSSCRWPSSTTLHPTSQDSWRPEAAFPKRPGQQGSGRGLPLVGAPAASEGEESQAAGLGSLQLLNARTDMPLTFSL